LNPDIPKPLGVSSKILKDWASHQLGDIPFDKDIIGQAKPKAEVLQGDNFPNTDKTHHNPPSLERRDSM
jgi:hypothetical protein